VFVDKHVQTEL